jgi:hypothetical protein
VSQVFRHLQYDPQRFKLAAGYHGFAPVPTGASAAVDAALARGGPPKIMLDESGLTLLKSAAG